MADMQFRELPLGGRLRTADDPAELISEGGVVDFQTLQNMRYTDKHPQSIGGITKINTNALSNPQIKSVFQYRKDSPAESNVLVSARDSNGLNQKVYRNGASIPATGDFTTTALFTDAAGYGTPMFSTAPQDKILYCNGKDTAMWGGQEMNPVGFIDMDPNNTYKYDYTTQVTNALTDANNVATLHRRADTIDANTVALFHFDTNLEDATTNNHDATAAGNAAITATQTKFGAKSCGFDGTGDWLTIANHADFNFSGTGSGGNFCVDMWAAGASGLGWLRFGTYFSHAKAGAGTDYIRLYRSPSTGQLIFEVWIGSSKVVNIVGKVTTTQAFKWSHLVVNGYKSGTTYNYYLFLDGVLLGSATHTAPPTVCDRAVVIGGWDNGASITDPVGYAFTAYIDELRVSKTSRWTTAFDPPTLAYGSSNITSLYVLSQLPLQGINLYVGTVNASAGAVTGNQWSASGWESVGTIAGVGAIPLSTAGKNTWTFASTVSTAKQKSVDDKVAYWFRFDITNCDTTTTVYQVTLDAPMQSVKELWDGAYRTSSSFLVYKNSTFNDYTINVLNDSWSSADTASFVKLDSLATATDFFIAGFTERMAGVRFHIIGGHVNTTAGTTVTVYRYNGSGPPETAASWTQVGTSDDGTTNGGISFAKNGTIMWTPPELSTEFRTSPAAAKVVSDTAILRTVFPQGSWAGSGISLYYYKFVFSKNFSADVQLFYVGGIPASENVSGHKFTVHHTDRAWYWGDEKDPHKGFCSGREAPQVLRGNDTATFWLKNTPVAGVSLFERFGSTAASVQIVCEPTRTWAITGETIENFRQDEIDSSRGCTAPLTMTAATVEVLPGTYRRVGLWQSQDAIVMCDGSTVVDISRDIRDKFDPKHANYIGASTLATCTGWVDPVSNEYHWVIPGSTQWVYDILRKKWYEAPLASGKQIACGCPVYDTNGVAYSYGVTNEGYCYRMEYGTTFDGEGISSVLQTGDIALTGGISDRTEVCSVRLLGKAKTVTSQEVAISHYADTSSTASVPAMTSISMMNSGKRLFNVLRSLGTNPKVGIFHSFRTSVTTTNETIGYEPIFATVGFRFVGKDTR